MLLPSGKTGVSIQENGATIVGISDARALSTTNTASIDLDASGAITVNSSGSINGIGIDNVNQAVNIGTNTTNHRTVNIGGDASSTIATAGGLTHTGNLTVSDGAYNLNIASHDGGHGLQLGGTLVTASADELNYLDITTLGTSQASKAVTVDANGDLLVPDSDKFKFGTGSDMQLYHDGTDSHITNATGALNIDYSYIRHCCKYW